MMNRQKVLLIVDDDVSWRKLVVDVAEDLELFTLEANTAEMALAASRHYVVDAAIVDIFMPGKGGLWLIDQLKSQHPGIKVISASGGYDEMSSENATYAAQKIGADAVITKPVRIDDLEAVLQAQIAAAEPDLQMLA